MSYLTDAFFDVSIFIYACVPVKAQVIPPLTDGYLTEKEIVILLSMCIIIFVFTRKTCPCNVYHLKPHSNTEGLGFAGVYIFFLLLLQNIDGGYSLEPPRSGGSILYPQSMFRAT